MANRLEQRMERAVCNVRALAEYVALGPVPIEPAVGFPVAGIWRALIAVAALARAGRGRCDTRLIGLIQRCVVPVLYATGGLRNMSAGRGKEGAETEEKRAGEWYTYARGCK